MANFPIPEEPQYSNEIRMLETTDRAHADIFNAVFQALINNMEYLRTHSVEDSQEFQDLVNKINEYIENTETITRLEIDALGGLPPIEGGDVPTVTCDCEAITSEEIQQVIDSIEVTQDMAEEERRALAQKLAERIGI